MEPQSQPRIVVIGVSYETDEMALRFVQDVTEAAQGTCTRILLVDNSERCDSERLFELIHADNPEVLCVRPPQNLGYLGGANFGFTAFLGTRQKYDWLIVSNVDVEFDALGFFAQLGSMKPNEDVGVIAPSIRSRLSHHDQNPFMRKRPSRARMRFYRLLYQSYYLLNVYRVLAATYHLARSTIRSHSGWRPTEPEGSSGRVSMQGASVQRHVRVPIYAAHGACMIFSCEFLGRGGSLEVPFFLYGEEIYVAETARALGLKVVYDPRLRVRHSEHQSTGRGSLILSRQAAKHLRDTINYLVHSFFSQTKS